MKANPRHLAIALAGLFQAVRLVQQAAKGRSCDSAALTDSGREWKPPSTRSATSGAGVIWN